MSLKTAHQSFSEPAWTWCRGLLRVELRGRLTGGGDAERPRSGRHFNLRWNPTKVLFIKQINSNQWEVETCFNLQKSSLCFQLKKETFDSLCLLLICRCLPGCCQHVDCGGRRGPAEAAAGCHSSLCAAELQACSGLRAQGEAARFFTAGCFVLIWI